MCNIWRKKNLADQHCHQKKSVQKTGLQKWHLWVLFGSTSSTFCILVTSAHTDSSLRLDTLGQKNSPSFSCKKLSAQFVSLNTLLLPVQHSHSFSKLQKDVHHRHHCPHWCQGHLCQVLHQFTAAGAMVQNDSQQSVPHFPQRRLH